MSAFKDDLVKLMNLHHPEWSDVSIKMYIRPTSKYVEFEYTVREDNE